MSHQSNSSEKVQVPYSPLQGEGEVQYIKRTRVRHECAVCGEPADFRHAYLLDNCRRNPGSSAYGRDDCTWCSDAESFVCAAHQNVRDKPDGMQWAGTYTLAKLPHMGLYWHEEKLPQECKLPAELQAARDGLLSLSIPRTAIQRATT